MENGFFYTEMLVILRMEVQNSETMTTSKLTPKRFRLHSTQVKAHSQSQNRRTLTLILTLNLNPNP